MSFDFYSFDNPSKGRPTLFRMFTIAIFAGPCISTYAEEHWMHEAKLFSSDSKSSDYFGGSVAIRGDTAIVGSAITSSAAPTDKGSAYVYVRNGTNWTPQAKLMSNPSGSDDKFGASVAIGEDIVVVGAPYQTVNSVFICGAVFVFVRNGTTWTQQARLLANDAASNDHFGWSVAIGGSTIVVGAPDASGLNENKGAAYVFVRNGAIWSQQARLAAPDGINWDQFGHSVSISGNTCIIGATFAESSKGSVYVFDRVGNTWSYQAEIIAADGHANDWFGWSCAIDAGTIVVGAHRHTGAAAYSQGAAYVFIRDNGIWSQQAQLAANDATMGDQFGHSVAISGNKSAVGAIGDDGISSYDEGSAYLFTRVGNNWTQEAKIKPNSASIHAQFGNSIGISNDTAIIGAYAEDGFAFPEAGAVYLFREIPHCCAGDMNGDGQINLQDVFPFAQFLANGLGGPYQLCSADANSDGIANAEDIGTFVSAIVNGDQLKCTE